LIAARGPAFHIIPNALVLAFIQHESRRMESDRDAFGRPLDTRRRRNYFRASRLALGYNEC
jgi:hypothetical protein